MSSYRRRLMLANQTEENLYLYGNSVQDGTPTPDVPIEIMSLENPTIKVMGKNLIPNSAGGTPTTSSTFTFSPNGDGTFTIDGAGNGSSYATHSLIGSSLNNMLIDNETYTFCLNNNNMDATAVMLTIRYRNLETNKDSWLTANLSKCVRFTVNKNLYSYLQLYLQINPTSQVYEGLVVKPMLTQGYYNELPFEHYEEQLIEIEGYTLRGIGDYKDRIYTKNGKVWFEQNIKHHITDSFAEASKNSAVIHSFLESDYPLCLRVGASYVRESEQMSNIGAYEIDYNKTGELHWYIAKSKSYLLPPDEETWTNGTDAYEYFMSVTGNIPMEYQYPLANPIITEITGALAEKILAIDKSKNITIYSDNGVYGNTEVVEE